MAKSNQYKWHLQTAKGRGKLGQIQNAIKQANDTNNLISAEGEMSKEWKVSNREVLTIYQMGREGQVKA